MQLHHVEASLLDPHGGFGELLGDAPHLLNGEGPRRATESRHGRRRDRLGAALAKRPAWFNWRHATRAFVLDGPRQPGQAVHAFVGVRAQSSRVDPLATGWSMLAFSTTTNATPLRAMRR